MRHILILWHILLFPFLAYSQICGLTDTTIVRSKTSVDIPIVIGSGDLVNEDLSDPGQGLCAIELDFVHGFVEEFALTLTSPAGQSVQLTGPTVTSLPGFPTFISRWRIAFVAGSIPAEPDPGFVARWDNDLMSFTAGFPYDGTYYPYGGDLEDFNMGSVVGTWTLTADNLLSFNDGGILGIRLVFCDQTGLDCCFADAGSFEEEKVFICEDDPQLRYIPDINFGNTPLDPDEYGYTYVVSREDGVILYYDSEEVDLSGAAPGTYQVCGLSYLRSDLSALPPADGQYTLADLYEEIYNPSPAFCADLTEDCQEVIIQEIPLPTNISAQICEGNAFTYLDTTYTEAGTHTYVMKTAGGCDSVINISLSVIPDQINNMEITICEGEAVLIGENTYNTPGIYRDTLPAASACDSIIVLDLNVVPDVTTMLNEVICRGDAFMVGNQSFAESGNYTVVLPSFFDCDSTVNLNLTVLDPQIDIGPVETITCGRPTVTLDAGNSTPAGSLDFEWRDSAGNILGAAATLTVNRPGDYTLRVTQTVSGTACTVQETIAVPGNEAVPTADAGPPRNLTCDVPEITLGGSGTSLGNEYMYSWTTDTGNFLDPQDLPSPRINAPGRYQLVVSNVSSSCTDTSVVNVDRDIAVPTVLSLPDTVITCGTPTILLTSDGSSQGANFAYEWRNSAGELLGTAADLNVGEGDSYQLSIRNTVNGCRDNTTVNVAVDQAAPQVTIAAPPVLNCERTSIRLNARVTDPDPDLVLTWESPDGDSIIQDANTLTPLVDAGGTYTLRLLNTRTGCETSAGVQVVDLRQEQAALPAQPDMIDCGTSIVSLDAGASSSGPDVIYRWSTSDGQFTGDSIGHTVSVNAPGTYTLTVLDTVSRCSDVATVTVEEDFNTPIAEAGPGFTLNCQLLQDTLFSTGSTGGPNISYNWAGPCLLSSPDSPWLIAGCAGTYYLEVTDRNNSCSALDSVEVRADQTAPTPAVATPDTLSCIQPEVEINATASGPINILEFNWTGLGITGTLTDPVITVELPGAYQLTLTDRNNFCSDTVTVNVVGSTQAPAADAGPVVSLTCDNPTGQIGGTNTATGPFLTYDWIELEGQLPAATDAPFVPVDQEGIYRLVVTDTRNGCRDSSSVVVVENKELPGADAGPAQEITCNTGLVTLDGTNSVQAPGITYQWSGPCLVGRTDTLTAQTDCPGVYLLTVTNTATGCSAVDSVLVTLDPVVLIAALPDTAFIDCTSGTAVLDGSASSNGLFEWTREGELVSSGMDQITVSEAGVYQLTVSNQDGSCAATDSIVVVSNCRPEISITPTGRITCQSPIAVIDASNSTGQFLVYEWIPPDPSCILSGQGTPVLEVSCGGDYTLILTNSFAMLSDTQTVAVEIDNTVPLAVPGPPDTLNCVQNEVVLDGSASSSGPNIIYRWTKVETGMLLAETASTVTEDPGTFTLEVIDTITQCRAEATIEILEYNLPISLSFGDSTIACGQDTFALTAFPTPLSDFYTYEWTGPEILDQADRPTVLVGQVGTYSLLITDQRSRCRTEASVTLSEEQQCVPCLEIATPDTIACDRPTVDLAASFCSPCTDCVVQWTSPDGNIVAGENTLTPTVDQPGTYQLTVIDQGFQAEASVEVAADDTPPPAIAGPDRQLTCDSTSVRLGTDPLTPPLGVVYRWEALDIPAFSSTSGPNVIVMTPGTYTLEARDTTTGCFSRDTVLVTYDTIAPVADAGPDQMLTCNESAVMLDAGGSSGGNEIFYTWSSSNPGNCLQEDNTLNPTVSCVGTYYLRAENSRTGCFSVDSVSVTTSQDIPALTPVPDTSLLCGQDSIELTGELPAPDGFSFSWCALDVAGQPVPGTCVSALSLMVGEAGAYQFSVSDELTGCEASFIVSVRDKRTAPLIDVGSDLTFRCGDDSLRISATTGTDTSLLDVQWRSLNNSPITGANTLHPVVYSADTLVLTVTNRQTACSAQDTLVIIEDLAGPGADAGPDTTLTCLQPALRLQGSALADDGSSFNFQWTTENGNILADADTPTPLIDRSGTYLLTVSNDQNACVATDEVTVSEAQELPQAVIRDPDLLQLTCEVDTLLLDASPSTSANGGALDYFWSAVADGNLIGDPAQPLIRSNAAGTYQLWVADQVTGCRDSLQFTLTAALDAPLILIAAPEELTCERTEVTLDATASEYGPAYTATWLNEQGEAILLDELELTVTEPGGYTLQIDNNENGCSSTSNPVTVSRNAAPPNVRIAPPDLLDCSINSVTLDGSASSGGPDLQYQWTTADGILLGGADRQQATAGGPGTYQLRILNTQNGCADSASIRVEAIAVPIAGIQTVITAPGCTNDAGGSILISEVSGGTPPFSFSLNNGAEITSGLFDQLRAGTYLLRIRGANGCEWEEELFVPAASPIDVDLGLDLTIISGDSVRLQAQTSSSDIISYQWDPAIADGPTAVVAPQISTSYGLTVTDSKGCSAGDRIRIVVEKPQAHFIPNVFSPDGDGYNDRFTIMAGPQIVNIASFRIYDRWGHLVFQRQDILPNDPQSGWDGRHNGSLMNAAVFVYFAELEYNDGRIVFVKGDVALLR